MQVRLRDIRLRGKETVDFCETVDLSDVHPHVRQETSVHAKARLRFAGGRYVLDGELTAELELVCAKCLTAFPLPLAVDWHEVFVPEDEWQEQFADDADVHAIASDTIDLVPYVRETLLLAIPFVPVCRDDCQGLCPRCGVNRNVSTCACKIEQIDPRLQELEKFFSKENDTSK
ncbi:YceD family protein [Numidum massiliense]|uniref:YceD family protein n=1 Tax=Numidum massiliense TaxID=1522315 RepID=UPI0006D56271|nr:YceD family protein [Numidum massiliense]